MDNFIIKELWINDNSIGDDGITSIATALTNSRLRVLGAHQCGITLTGARSVATLLLVNESLKILYLQDNPLTTEGAHLILQSAVNNKVCLVDIHVGYEYRSEEI